MMTKEKNFSPKTSDHGLIIVYYGEGKGKTSAALGGVLRASGHNLKVLVIQFIKGPWVSGERKAIKKFLPNVKIEAMGVGFVGILGDRKPRSIHRETAKLALKRAEKEIKKGKWQIIVLDEILGTIKGNLITVKEVLKIVKNKPKSLDLILTGQPKIKEIIDTSDLVTEMKKIKHPFDKKILAKKGIDF